MREKINLLFAVVLTFFLSISHAFEISNHFELHINYGFIIILTLVCVMYIFALKTLKGKMIYHVLIISSIVLLLLGVGLFLLNASHEIGNIISWSITYQGNPEDYQPFYAYTVMVLTSIILTTSIFFMVSNQISCYVLALCYLVGMILASIFGVHLNRFSEMVLISFLLTNIAYLGGYFIHKSRKVTERENTKAFFLPVGIFFALVIAVFPYKDTPIEWKSIKRLVNFTVEYVQDIATELSWKQDGKDGLFSIAMSGYSDTDDELGGDVATDHRTVLWVNADSEDAKYPLYFIGSINDNYTGSRWERAKEEDGLSVPEYFLNYLESYVSFGTVSEISEHMVRSQNIRITYADMRTKTLFYPNGTRRIKLSEEDKLLQPYDTNLLFKKIAKQGTSYQIQCFTLNLNEEQVKQRLILMEDFSYQSMKAEDFEQILKVEKRFYPFSILNTLHELNGPVLKDLMMKRAANIYEKYTVLPEVVPQRVYELAEEITKDHKSKYEKLKAIESYVASYEYITKSTRAKEGEDFVDQFLFEEKKGYCTSFASAMAVLARCVDIPTRYVEGYLCTYENQSKGTYYITNKDAHAWVEAYFEGVGWIAFEPTRGFEENRYQVWSEREKKPEESSSVSVEDLEKYKHNFSQNELDSEEQNRLNKKENTSVAIWFLLSCILVCVVLLSVLLLIAKIRFTYKYKHFSNEQKVEFLYMRILQYYKRKGFLRQPYETLTVYVQKLKEAKCEQSKEFERLTNLYMKFCYGGYSLTKEDVDQFSAFGVKMASIYEHRRERIINLLDNISFMMRV